MVWRKSLKLNLNILKITCFKGVVVFFFWLLFFLAGFLLGVPFGLFEASEMSPFFRACYENKSKYVHVTKWYRKSHDSVIINLRQPLLPISTISHAIETALKGIIYLIISSKDPFVSEETCLEKNRGPQHTALAEPLAEGNTNHVNEPSWK